MMTSGYEKKKGNIGLKLSSKKLSSGKCQVKFYITIRKKKQLYGYVLADARTTLKEVVENIERRLTGMQDEDLCHHWNLYRIGKQKPQDLNIYIFEN